MKIKSTTKVGDVIKRRMKSAKGSGDMLFWMIIGPPFKFKLVECTSGIEGSYEDHKNTFSDFDTPPDLDPKAVEYIWTLVKTDKDLKVYHNAHLALWYNFSDSKLGANGNKCKNHWSHEVETFKISVIDTATIEHRIAGIY